MAFYFAYGDRMNAEKMAGSIPGARLVGPGRLDGYRLAFNGNSRTWGGGAANARPPPPPPGGGAARCPGLPLQRVGRPMGARGRRDGASGADQPRNPGARPGPRGRHHGSG